MLERACTHAAGPYAYENFEIEGYAYYTNNPPAGAFRGFGVTQTCFAVEMTLHKEMADKVGISPLEIRLRNAIRPGGILPNGQIVGPETGLVETLEAVRPSMTPPSRREACRIGLRDEKRGRRRGSAGHGRCKLIVEADEKLHIYSGASCIGQGLGTVLVQMTVTNTLHREQIVYERRTRWIAPDFRLAPDARDR